MDEKEIEFKTPYAATLSKYLGDLGNAVVEWIERNTTNEEFYEQPVNIHQPERLLIDHAVSTFGRLIKESKNEYSVQIDGKWVYSPPFTVEQLAQVSLLHILGNVGKYKREIKGFKTDKLTPAGKAVWEDRLQWVYNENNNNNFGTDGESALFIIHDITTEYGIEPLDREVELAILHINGIFDNTTKTGFYPKLWKEHPLTLLANHADMKDTYMYKEPKKEEDKTE
jgi:hypothetical protein